MVPVSSGSQGIKTWFDGAVHGDAFKLSIVSAIRNLSSTNGLDVGTSLDPSNIQIVQITKGVSAELGRTMGFHFLFRLSHVSDFCVFLQSKWIVGIISDGKEKFVKYDVCLL